MSYSMILKRNGTKGAILVLAIIMVSLLTVTIAFATHSLSVVPASSLTGFSECRAGFIAPQCTAVQFDTNQDFAFQGNGFAQNAVSKNNISGFGTIHQPEFANDGFYGNGASS